MDRDVHCCSCCCCLLIAVDMPNTLSSSHLECSDGGLKEVTLLKRVSPKATALTAIFIILHGIALMRVFATSGDPYKAVVDELIQDAINNGTVLELSTLESTEERPLPSQWAPSPTAALAIVGSLLVILSSSR